MRQEKNSQIQPVIKMKDICDRFQLSRRYCRILIRRGIIQAKPLQYRRRPNSTEMRAIDYFVTRAEYHRLERVGMIAPEESEVVT
jgi:hypothetical protein